MSEEASGRLEPGQDDLIGHAAKTIVTLSCRRITPSAIGAIQRRVYGSTSET